MMEIQNVIWEPRAPRRVIAQAHQSTIYKPNDELPGVLQNRAIFDEVRVVQWLISSTSKPKQEIRSVEAPFERIPGRIRYMRRNVRKAMEQERAVERLILTVREPKRE